MVSYCKDMSAIERICQRGNINEFRGTKVGPMDPSVPYLHCVAWGSNPKHYLNDDIETDYQRMFV